MIDGLIDVKSAKIACIHEISPLILDNIDRLKEFDLLTFDDGLYSQYHYKDIWISLGIPCIFFITSDFICGDPNIQNKNFITCVEAHKLAFNNDYSYYMTLDQIKELDSVPGFEIGLHSKSHKDINDLSITQIDDEIKLCHDFFINNKLNTNYYCPPYDKTNIKFDILMKRYKFIVMGNRINIELFLGGVPCWQYRGSLRTGNS